MIRARFSVTNVQRSNTAPTMVTLTPKPDDAIAKDQRLWRDAPPANLVINLATDNPDAFERGGIYYLEITKAKAGEGEGTRAAGGS